MKFINKEEYGNHIYFQDNWSIKDYFSSKGQQKIALFKDTDFKHTRYTSSWPNTIAPQAHFHLGLSAKYNMEQWLYAHQATTHLSLLGENTMDFYLAKQTVKQKNPLLFVDGSASHSHCKSLIDYCLEQGVKPYLFDYNHFLELHPEYQCYQAKFQHLSVKLLDSFLLSWVYQYHHPRLESDEYQQLKKMGKTLLQSLDDCFINFSSLKETLSQLQDTYPLAYEPFNRVLSILEKLDIFAHYHDNSTTHTPIISHFPLFEKNTAIIVSVSPQEHDFLQFLSHWLYWHISHSLGTDLSENYADVIEKRPEHLSYIKSLIFRQIELAYAPNLASMARALRFSVIYSTSEINKQLTERILPNSNTLLFFPSENNYSMKRIYNEVMGEYVLYIYEKDEQHLVDSRLLVPFSCQKNEFIVFNRHEFQKIKFNEFLL
jgi:hypothetical protein